MEKRRKPAPTLALCAIAALLCATSCSVDPRERDRSALPPLPRPARESHSYELPLEARLYREGRSVKGRAIRAEVLPSLHPAGSGEGPRVLVLGAIHGDEPGSDRFVRDLMNWLRWNPRDLAGCAVCFVSPLNPDGLAAGRRVNSRGVDLNRNFPARNFRKSRRTGQKPLSEPESRFLADLIREFQPKLILSVHQPRGSVNFDGPALFLAETWAAASGYPVESEIPYATPGSLGSWIGVDQGLPILTLELSRKPRRAGSFLSAHADAFRATLRAFRSSRRKTEEHRGRKTVEGQS